MYLKVSGDIGFTLKSVKGEKVGGSDALVGSPPFLWHTQPVFTCSSQRKATESSL